MLDLIDQVNGNAYHADKFKRFRQEIARKGQQVIHDLLLFIKLIACFDSRILNPEKIRRAHNLRVKLD